MKLNQSPVFLLLCAAIAGAPVGVWADGTGSDAYDRGQYGLAQRYFESDLARARQSGKRDRIYSGSLSDLANIYYMEGKMDRSEQLYRELVPLDEELYGKDSLRVSKDLYALSRCLRRQLRWNDAQPVLQRVLDIRRQQLGENDVEVARSWLDIAVNYERRGMLPEAEEAFQKTIAIRQTLPDKDHHMLRLALAGYIHLLLRMNKIDEATQVLQQTRAFGKASGAPTPAGTD